MESRGHSFVSVIILFGFIVCGTVLISFIHLDNTRLRHGGKLSFKKSAASSTNSSTGRDSKDTDDLGIFTLGSSKFSDNGYYPDEYTCLDPDTGGISPQLYWNNAPDGAEEFMIVMWSHHDGYNCDRYEWVQYGIESKFTSIKEGNPKGIGEFGGTYPGSPKFIYSPPCSSGEGNKTYHFTIYALSDSLSKYAKKMDDDYNRLRGPDLVRVALDADIVLDTATLTTQFSSERGPPPPVDGSEEDAESHEEETETDGEDEDEAEDEDEENETEEAKEKTKKTSKKDKDGDGDGDDERRRARMNIRALSIKGRRLSKKSKTDTATDTVIYSLPFDFTTDDKAIRECL
jgi:phosphatidylethanolamine-binding protein (PEBP) family uncharacterized protein